MKYAAGFKDHAKINAMKLP